MDPLEELSEILKALAHPERLRLLAALRGGEKCVCHLTALLGQRQPYVSQQLSYLKDAGLIADRKQGLRVYYRVRDPRLYQVLDALGALTGDRDAFRTEPASDQALEGCPCPECREASRTEGGRRWRSKSLDPAARTA